MCDQFQVAYARVAGGDKAMTDARFVDLYAQKVVRRLGAGLLYQGVTIAEADFEHTRCLPAEHAVEIQ